MNTTLPRLPASIVHPCWVIALAFLLPGSGFAFPPAPDHQIYGMVRDALGEPLMIDNAVVILETADGVQIKTSVVPNLEAGVNYRLSIPMDAGLTSDNYKPTALRPLVSFRLKVIIGTTTYLPLELKGSYANLGKPAGRTHLDLTLGEDSNGDGLPDAWQSMVIDMLGGTGILALGDITPDGDADGDGMSNMQEYIAGTYAFDSTDALKLDIAGFNAGRPLLDFMVIGGRSYAIQASTNLTAWSAVNFSLPAEASGAPPMARYAAKDVRTVRAEAYVSTNAVGAAWYFRLNAQ